MSAANRIPGKGRLTPALTARFTIDGRTLTAYEGDTVASAMIANGMQTGVLADHAPQPAPAVSWMIRAAAAPWRAASSNL